MARFTAKRLLSRELSLSLMVLGCTPTELEVGRGDPAHPAAPVAPLAPVGRALKAGFDPQGNGSAAHGPGSDPHAGHAPGPRAQASGHAGHTQKAPEMDKATPAWTCPMHPEVRRSEPGNCPICGMKLQPMPEKADGGAP